MPNFLKEITLFNEKHLVLWVIAMILFFIIKNLIQINIIKYQSTFVFNIATDLSSKLTNQFLQRPYSYIQSLDTGKEIQKIQRSGSDFANHILLSVNSLFTEMTLIVFISLASFILYPKFSIFIFILSTICLYILYRIRKEKINQISESIQNSYSKSTSSLLNIINGFLEIKSLKKEGFFLEKFKVNLTTFNSNFAVLKKHQGSNSKYLEVFIIIALSIFLYYINTSLNIVSEKIFLIAYVAGISLKLFPSLNKIILAYTNYKSFSYTIDVFSKNIETSNSSLKIKSFKNNITLKNISFSYSAKNKLLENINLTIQKGQLIGIKGRSGIGKTTLLNIIMNLITPNTGNLLLDKIMVKENDDLFNFIGYSPQDPFLFQGSLLSNFIIDVKPNEINFKRLQNLIDTFELSEFVANLPNGLDTRISHDTLSISGGQKQRIALIRILYSQPQLLILDEVTNQLDEELEEKVVHFLKKHAQEQNIAIILVSHSTAVIKNCDKMFEILNNTLIEI